MKIRSALKIVAPTQAAIGLAMVGCAGVSLLYGEQPHSLLIGGFAAIAYATITWLLCKDADMHHLGLPEGCLTVTLTWLLSCFFGAIPLYVMWRFGSPTKISFIQSYFELVSGFTTSGTSIFTDVEILPKGILFWRSLTHWFGGMGIVVFAVAILPSLGVGGMQAFRWEAPGPMKTDKLVPKIRDTAMLLYLVYMVVTIIQIIALYIVGTGIFNALVYTFGTVGTGGLAVHNTSVAGMKNPSAEWIIAFFMWISAMNFGLTYLLLFKRDWRSLLKDTEWKAYIVITMLVTFSIAFIVWGYVPDDATSQLWSGLPAHPWSFMEALRYAFFQMATIMSTTGYATYDYNQWPLFALGILCIPMFIGGCTGSTGGGVKVMRHVVSWKFIKHEVQKLVRPNLVTTIQMSGRTIDLPIIQSVLALVVAYFLFFFAGGIAMTAYGYDLVTAFTASIANLGNIGPGLNIVGPAGNYSSFPPSALVILFSLMLIGRLEVFTILVLLLPSTWRKRD